MSKRGFSLLEALFGMLITFLVLSAVVYILQQAVTVRGSVEEVGSFTELSHAIGLIRRDLATAIRVDTPTGTSAHRIVVRQIDESQDFLTRVADGNAFDSTERIRVEYERSDGILRRQVYDSLGNLRANQRLLACSSFETGRTLSLITIKVGIEKERSSRIYAFQCRVMP
ncbi:MAG: type II secretion system protein J [Vulcanimicrobiota bacterium]